MSARWLGLVAFVAFVALGAGCRLSSFSISAYDHDDHGHRGYAQREYVPRTYVHHEPAPVRVYTQRGHVCGHNCNDHYWNGVEIVVLDGGHRHGAHCGHHWSGSRWTLVAKTGGKSPHYKKAGKSHRYKKAKFKVKKGRRH